MTPIAAGNALGGALLGVLVFLVASQLRRSGYIALAIALLAVVFVTNLLLYPTAVMVVEGLYFGDLEFLIFQIGYFLSDTETWAYRFQDYQYFFIPSFDKVVIALVVTISVMRANRGQEAAMTHDSTFTSNSAFAGLARRHDWSEINRLILAHACTSRSGFRQSVIARARESFDAPAPEVGIDMERLVKLCLWRERKETGYRFLLLLFLLAAFIGFAVLVEEENPAFLVLVLLTVAAVNGYRRARLYARTHRLYGLGNFSADLPNEAQGVNLSEEETHGLAPAGQNVVVYSGFTPFEFAGIAVGGWAVSIDTTRSSTGMTSSREAKPFTEGELRSFIADRLRESRIEGLSVRDLVIAQGSDAPDLPAARTFEGVSQPRVRLEAEEVERLTGGQPNTFRRYVWISVRDWGGELLVSAFWRCALKDHMLQIELSRFLLTPLARRNRSVDSTKSTWQHAVNQFIAGVVLSPFALIAGPLILLGQFQAGLARLFGSERRARAKAIKVNPRYNFGAPKSLRVDLMGNEFLHYFQKMDHEHYQRSLDKILLESLVSFLDDHGIDTADLKETQTAIFNSGVIVQGGDITAQSLAVGERAKARTGIVGRAFAGGTAAGGIAKAS